MNAGVTHPRPIDADGWFDAYCDGSDVRFAEGVRRGIDRDPLRVLAERSLRDLLSGRNVPEQMVHLDLDTPWHFLRVELNNGFAVMGGGTQHKSSRYLMPARALVQALHSHLAE